MEYYDCAQAFGKLMSTGNSSATEIAEASIWSCQEYQTVAIDDYKAYLRRNAPKATEIDIYERQKALEDVMVIKAKRAATYAAVVARALPKQRK